MNIVLHKPVGVGLCNNGSCVLSRMSVKRNRSIMPSKMQIPVRLFVEIPAQMCTLTGCFGLQEQYNVMLLCTCV